MESNTNTDSKPYSIEFKNPGFEKNVIDPTNGKIVKSIYAHNWTKLARDHWFMVWQFYRDRNRTSIQQVYDKYKDTQIEIIYKGDPTKYLVGEKKPRPEAQIRNKDKKELVAKIKKEEEQKLKELVKTQQIPQAVLEPIQESNQIETEQIETEHDDVVPDESESNDMVESEKKPRKKKEVQPPQPKKQEVVTDELRVLYEERARIQVQAKYFQQELKKCNKRLHEINKQVHRIKNPDYNKPKAPQFPNRIKNKEKYDKNKERNKLLKQQKENKDNSVSV
jgi:hypothetical protein